MTPRLKPLLGWALASLLFASFTRPARASATFPEALRSQLGLEQIAGPAPGCRLCHQSDLGGLKTATQPLGRSLVKAGAAASSVPSLLAALDALEEQATDSDRDSVPDIEELRAGTDPNVAMVVAGEGGAPPAPSLAEQAPLPETGCGVAQRPSAPATWTALTVALFLLVRRSRRR